VAYRLLDSYRIPGSHHEIMSYEINHYGDVSSVYSGLDDEAASRIRSKLSEIAENDYRDPEQWFDEFPHPAGNKITIGSYRVFADVDSSGEEIIVHDAKHRQNVYR